jgi:hypothetical protein
MAGGIGRLVSRGRTLPWARLYVLGEWAYRKGRAAHGGLTAHERAELGRILRKSRGRPRNITRGERERMAALVRKAFTAARRG